MLSRSHTVAKPNRAGIVARNWKRFGCLTTWFAVANISLVMATPLGMALRWLQEYIPMEELRDERICLIPILVALLYFPSRVGPWINYSFGGRSGNRRFGRRVIPESIAFLQYDLRRWILALVGAQLISLAIAYWGLYQAEGHLGLIRSFHWLILLPLAFGVLGTRVFLFWQTAISAYARSQERRLDRQQASRNPTA